MAAQEAKAADEKDAKKEEAAKKPKKEYKDPVELSQILQVLAVKLGRDRLKDPASYTEALWKQLPMRQALESLGKSLPESRLVGAAFLELQDNLHSQFNRWVLGERFDQQEWDNAFANLKRVVLLDAKGDNKELDKKIQEIETFAKEKHLEQQRKLKEDWDNQLARAELNQRMTAYSNDGAQTAWERIGEAEAKQALAAQGQGEALTIKQLEKLANEQQDGWYKRRGSDVKLKVEKGMVSGFGGSLTERYTQMVDYAVNVLRATKSIMIEWPTARLGEVGGTAGNRIDQINTILAIAAGKGLKVELGKNAMDSLLDPTNRGGFEFRRDTKVKKVMAAINEHNERIEQAQQKQDNEIKQKVAVKNITSEMKNKTSELSTKFEIYDDCADKLTNADLSNASNSIEAAEIMKGVLEKREAPEQKPKLSDRSEPIILSDIENVERNVQKQLSLITKRLETVKQAQEVLVSQRDYIAKQDPQQPFCAEQTKVLKTLEAKVREHFDDLKIRVDGLQELAARGSQGIILKDEDKKALSGFAKTIVKLQPEIRPELSVRSPRPA